MVNRDVVRSWITVGGERGKYLQFCEIMRCGTYNRTSFDQTVELLIPIILELEDEQYRKNIDDINKESGCILGFDCQHSRSQRACGSAPLATTTFMCHNHGSNYGKIVYQSTLSFHQMKEMGLKGTESKDKLTTKLGLEKLVDLLTYIKQGVCDGSSSGNKLWMDVVVPHFKHKNANLANCSWHKIKTVSKDFKKKIMEKRIKLKVKKGRKQYKLAYPEIQELGITGQVIKNHWIYSQKMSHGNPKEMAEEFKHLTDFYQELYEGYLSQTTEKALEEWLELQCKNIGKYSDGLLTDLEESFHHKVLKYWKKGSSYGFEEYTIRRALAFLDWNENFGKIKTHRTINFRKLIADHFSDFMQNTKTATGVYIPKKYGVRNYV
jgi:hypothetical protein